MTFLILLMFIVFNFMYASVALAGAVILDNNGPDTYSTGKWRFTLDGNPYGNHSLHSTQSNATYTYKISVPEPGEYQVLAWWIDMPEAVTNVPYTIRHQDGSSTVTVNQKLNSGMWNPLGTWQFDKAATITITSNGNGRTSADAIMLSPVTGNNLNDFDNAKYLMQNGTIALNWIAPVARSDDSPLLMSEIAGFIIYYGNSSGNYANMVTVNDSYRTSTTINGLPAGTYYLVMTTRDTEGRESTYSSEISKVVH